MSQTTREFSMEQAVDTGRDKVKQICEVLRKETLEPAIDEAKGILEDAQKKGQQIVAEAKEKAAKMIADAEREAGDIESISPTSDRSKMGHYDGPKNSSNLAARRIYRPLPPRLRPIARKLFELVRL